MSVWSGYSRQNAQWSVTQYGTQCEITVNAGKSDVSFSLIDMYSMEHSNRILFYFPTLTYVRYVYESSLFCVVENKHHEV